MPNVRVENDFSGDWKDYKMFALTAPSDGRTYITGYRKSDNKQIRKYEYQREIMSDDDIPNSIDEINKIVNYKANPREWMKLYMRARRALDYKGGGTRDNPKSAFPDSNFQREGARKRGPGRKRDKERDKAKLKKMRRRIKEGRIKEDKEREAQKRKYEEQYKINKIYDSYLDMLADKSEEELKELEEKGAVKRTKKQEQNFKSAYKAAEKRAEDQGDVKKDKKQKQNLLGIMKRQEKEDKKYAEEREQREKEEKEEEERKKKEKEEKEDKKLNKDVIEKSEKLSTELEGISFGDFDDFEDFEILEDLKEKNAKKIKQLEAKEVKAEDDIDLMEIQEERDNIEKKYLRKTIAPLRRQIKIVDKKIDEANKSIN